MSSRHKIDAEHTTGLSVRIDYRYSRGLPAVMYLRNGDPGYPAEPAEVEFIACNYPGFETWAEAWLADHYEDAIEQAKDDHERDREDAREAGRSIR